MATETAIIKRLIQDIPSLSNEEVVALIRHTSQEINRRFGTTDIQQYLTEPEVIEPVATTKLEPAVEPVVAASIQKPVSSELIPKPTTPHSLLVNLIRGQTEKEDAQDIWKTSPFKDAVKLQNNNRGIVGESLIQQICAAANLPSNVNGLETKQTGGGAGDGTIKGKSIEIKTASQGTTGESFQHELGEVPWKADYMLFIDLAPTVFYITIFKNFTEEHYKSGKKCLPVFPTKSVTWRKEKGAFKLDTSIKINEENVKNRHAIKATNTTTLEEIAAFINETIN